MARVLLCLAALVAPLFSQTGFSQTSSAPKNEIKYWIQPCSVMIASCQPGDADLARWAFAAWEQASGGRIKLVESKTRSESLIRLLWADKDSGLFGEAVRIYVNGRIGRELHIQLADVQKDTLLRDTIVYLTCLHESGHALGLDHTRAFADIMYNFQLGGDIDEYFGRFRRKLTSHEDVAKYSGLSPADRDALIESIGKGVPR
jgi:hypothetical protein